MRKFKSAQNIYNSNGKLPESNITCVGKFAQDMAYALHAERRVPLQWAVLRAHFIRRVT